MEHEWNRESPRAFVFPHRVIVKDVGPVAQQFVPDESGQSFWEDIEVPASVCAEILRLAELARYHEGRSFDNAALAHQWMRSHDALLALLQEHAPSALLSATLPPTPSPEGTEALARLAERVKELEESSAHNAELAEKALRDRAGEAARIRKELLEAIRAETGTYYNGGEIAVRAVSAATLLAALDRIIPEP